MKRLLDVSALVIMSSVFMPSCGVVDRAKSERASVLLVTIDTLRADRVGAYGGPAGLTPTMDRLAAAGIVFEEAVSSAPLTLPSHATILSGRWPLHHGVHDNGRVFDKQYETLATRFKAAGFSTAAFVSAAVLDHRFGLDRGFDVYDDRIVRASRGRSTLESERACGQTVAAANQWIRSQQNRSFVWIHLYEPHAPYTAGGADAYNAEVAAADGCLKQALDALPRANRDWFIAVTSDHGEGLGEHGEETHGLFIYQSTLRVPLILQGPGIEAAGKRGGLARTVDLAPTLLRLVGAEPLSGIDGIDLFSGPAARESYAETEYPRAFGWAPLHSWRIGAKKIIDGSKPELFDLDSDSGEVRNLAAHQANEIARLQSVLKAARATAVIVADQKPLSAEVQERLRSLGYVAGGGNADPSASARDPKEALPFFRDFESAMAAEARGDLKESVRRLRALTAVDPSNLTFLRALGSALRRSGQLAEAIRVLKAASALAPNDAILVNDLSTALGEAGQAAEALREARRATTLAPDYADAQDQLAGRLAATGDLTGALAASERAVALDRNSARAWTNRGNLLRAAGRGLDARVAFETALGLDAEYADALNGFGVILVESGDLNRAAETFTQALKSDPTLDDARLNFAIVEHQRGNHVQAIGLAEVVARGATDPALRRRANAFLRDIR